VPRSASYVRGVHVLGRVLVALRFSVRAVLLFSSRAVAMWSTVGWLCPCLYDGALSFFGLLTTMKSCSLGGSGDGWCSGVHPSLLFVDSRITVGCVCTILQP